MLVKFGRCQHEQAFILENQEKKNTVKECENTTQTTLHTGSLAMRLNMCVNHKVFLVW